MGGLMVLISGFIIVVGFISVILLIQYILLWIEAIAAKAGVSFVSIIGMRLRKVPPHLIVRERIKIVKAGLDISTDALEAHFLAGGNVFNVTNAIIAADRANLELNFQEATGIDLAGRDIVDAVRTRVKPKVIDCPDPTKGRSTVDAVAKDGIQVKAKARVTVRTNLKRLIGGAGEETIIARVGEGIVTTIGSADTHKHVLENPDSISQKVLAKGLDSGTAFEILSIDIADVDIGENIGAKLQADQAEADKRKAQAEAEKRRAMAVALEQENQAKVQEMRAKVVEAEAQIPQAIAESFRNGNLGIMDYYKMKNILADTDMRSSIAGKKPEANKNKMTE